jgi:phage terminase small subunit
MPRKKSVDLPNDLVATKSKRVTKPKAPRGESVILNARQEAFVDARASGLKVKDAMSVAGMKPHDGTGNALEKHPAISQALLQERAKNAKMLGLKRDDILQGFMDAIEQAKTLADPMSQIAGWREIAKVCGFYAPEVKKVEISGAGRRILDKMASLPYEELLQIAQGDVIEGDYTEVKH